MSSASMYVRVKRHKATVFLHVDPTDTVHNVKVKIEDLMRKEPTCQQLYKDGVELDGKRTMVDLKIENNDVLVLALKRDDGTWESADNVVALEDDAVPGDE